MSSNSAPEPEYRFSLNALRGFAALYVVLYHLHWHTSFNWLGIFPALRFGYIGVDFFFILSGLIISHVYLAKSENGSPAFWTTFIWLRIARLLPVHLLLMVILAVVSLIGLPLSEQSQSWADWLSLTLLVHQWALPDGYVWNGPAWSVSAELFAYLFVFPLVAWLSRLTKSVRLGVWLILPGIAIMATIISLFGTINAIGGAGPLMRVTAGFLIGSGLFLLLDRRKWRIDWAAVLIWTGLALVPFFAALLLLQAQGLRVDILLVGYVVIVITATYSAGGRVAQFLSSAPLFWLGEISFSLYLCHMPVLRAMSYVGSTLGIERGFWFGVAQVAVSIITAHLLFCLVEIPARSALRSWYGRVPFKSIAGFQLGSSKAN